MGCCGGRGQVANTYRHSNTPQPASAPKNPMSKPLVKLIYVGLADGALPFYGPVTQRMYYFGRARPEGYVFADDVKGMVELKSKGRRVFSIAPTSGSVPADDTDPEDNRDTVGEPLDPTYVPPRPKERGPKVPVSPGVSAQTGEAEVLNFTAAEVDLPAAEHLKSVPQNGTNQVKTEPVLVEPDHLVAQPMSHKRRGRPRKDAV